MIRSITDKSDCIIDGNYQIKQAILIEMLLEIFECFH